MQALSDEERAEIEHQDPAVKEMIDRACAVTPEELLTPARSRSTLEPPQPSAAVRDPTRGLPEAEVDGVVFRRGARCWCDPGSRPTCRRACSRGAT